MRPAASKSLESHGNCFWRLWHSQARSDQPQKESNLAGVVGNNGEWLVGENKVAKVSDPISSRTIA